MNRETKRALITRKQAETISTLITRSKKVNAANFSDAILLRAYFSNADSAPTKTVEGIFTEEQLKLMKHEPEVLKREDARAWLNQPESDDGNQKSRPRRKSRTAVNWQKSD
jgi:hypothetical protein